MSPAFSDVWHSLVNRCVPKGLRRFLQFKFDTTIPILNTSLRPGDADEAVLSACFTLVTIINPDGYDEQDFTATATTITATHELCKFPITA